MYSENPDVYKVDRLRNQYFEQNNKQHDVYTRWYKRWRRYIAPFVTDNGRILIPSAAERLQEASIINKSSSRDVGSWNYLGPKNHVNVKFDNNDSHVLISDHSNVYCFERCTSNPTVFYCGTESGGVYKSIDAGQNWTYVTKGLSVESVTAISVDPTNPDIVIFSAADEIWRSSNGGTTWSIVGNTAFQALNIEVYQFNWHPTNNQIIYAGTNLGLYRSNDNGLNWSQVFNGECMSVEFKPGNPQIMYALRYNSVTQIADFYKSNDGGNTFTIRPQGWFQVPAADAGPGSHHCASRRRGQLCGECAESGAGTGDGECAAQCHRSPCSGAGDRREPRRCHRQFPDTAGQWDRDRVRVRQWCRN
jgi:hypothetical protein